MIEKRIKNVYTGKKRDFPYCQPLAVDAGGLWWVLAFFCLTEIASSSSMFNSPYGINHVSAFGFSGIQWEGWLCEKVRVELAAQ